jgi:hypothetical protein
MFAVYDSLNHDIEFKDTKEEALQYLNALKEAMDEDATDGWEGSEELYIMEVLQKYSLVEITEKYLKENELDKVPNGWDDILELQITYEKK